MCATYNCDIWNAKYSRGKDVTHLKCKCNNNKSKVSQGNNTI